MTSSVDHHTWLHFTQGKDWSRLLYPNPVCFLCTSVNVEKSFQEEEKNDEGKEGTPKHQLQQQLQQQQHQRNVMTISWLTPTNNEGRFLLSLNRRRFTAQYFFGSRSTTGRDFCLCVPTTQLQDLVLAVGKVSGRFGSKFVATNDDDDDEHNEDCQSSSSTLLQPPAHHLTKKQRRQWEQKTFAKGIPGLVARPFDEPLDTSRTLSKRRNGTGVEEETNSSDLFFIDGTVARLHCRVIKVVDNDDSALSLVDSEHLLVAAQVVQAYCRSDFWDDQKRLFRPNEQSQERLLTFLGSQTFGKVDVI